MRFVTRRSRGRPHGFCETKSRPGHDEQARSSSEESKCGRQARRHVPGRRHQRDREEKCLPRRAPSAQNGSPDDRERRRSSEVRQFSIGQDRGLHTESAIRQVGRRDGQETHYCISDRHWWKLFGTGVPLRGPAGGLGVQKGCRRADAQVRRERGPRGLCSPGRRRRRVLDQSEDLP